MKKKIVIFIDILTVILLAIQIQSMLVFVSERFSILCNYSWDCYFVYYYGYGITHTILSSTFEKLYFWIVTITFFLNLYAIVVKLKDIRKKELVRRIYRGFIVFNLIFVVLKALEFYINLIILMHA